MCMQRPESHNAHIFSVICDGRKILEHWNTHFAQSSLGPPDRRQRQGSWRPADSNRTGAASRSAPPPSNGGGRLGWHAGMAHRLTLAHRGVCQGVPVCQDRGWWEAGRCGHRRPSQSTRNRIPRRFRYLTARVTGRPRGRQVGGPRFGTLTREYLSTHE